MNSLNNNLSPFVDTTWEPVEVSTSKELAAEILSDDFQNGLESMINEFESLFPSDHYDNGKGFIPLSKRKEILEKNFAFGTFSISNQFINLFDDAPICVSTIYVLTEKGYEPWFSRMGMGSSTNPSSDGLLADAETSALRRLMAALGMGNESSEEVADSDRLNRVNIISLYLKDNSMSLLKLIENYKSHGSRYSLPELKNKSYPSSKSKKEEIEVFDYSFIGDGDLSILVSYISKVST